MPFESDLVLHAPFGDDDYVLSQPLIYRRPDGQVVTVPAGFRTDLASIPRLLWRVLPRDGGTYRAAAVVHDYLVGRATWRQAADVFGEALSDNGTGRFRRWVMVKAVRVWGLAARA